MKKNTIKSKELIEQALQILPREYALSNTRAFLTRALSEIKKIENREDKKEETKKIESQPIFLTPQQQKIAINHLDLMIKNEEKNLAKYKNNKHKFELKKPVSDKDIIDD
jgi:hypothetical protein